MSINLYQKARKVNRTCISPKFNTITEGILMLLAYDTIRLYTRLLTVKDIDNVVADMLELSQLNQVL